MATPRRSVLAMALLSMLSEEPMHAYRIQQLIKERHKDDVVNVAQRNSVYQTLDRLLRDGLIEVQATERAENRPERTTYRLTEPGRMILRQWLTTMLAEPAREFPEFPAALAFLPSLTPDEAAAALRARVAALERNLEALAAGLAGAAAFLPRLFVVEDEYRRAVLAAELGYVRALTDDIAAGRLRW
ncbi:MULTISPECIES: PadR family transcriptional regulator [Rhodococcus]|uniref:Transcriptional regulator, PadR family n=1 Tax=Rhodococcus aetherivorans TaxID=191292 RepID=A0ABQ0YSM3_9NOCA|nr:MULTISPECIES: PadR family transcriptional regulator [Rhodococcus]ETT25448.1 transcriptional regulator, PadR-like family [Rhodococcus rhodochrous ATCC 21198]NGP24631.1 PadR family transcriptional regulator [Rhodococcus aetherivorans]USC16759.1 PadR family transcriptional regulator [Rhodococcus sp. 11-3]GES39633.1 transcriptional regulator, PadR family [Rhodococcus aetherivorans]